MLPRLLWRCSGALHHGGGAPGASAALARTLSSSAPPPPAPEKVECFVDGKKVLVDPGTTVLQVRESA